MFHPQSYTPSEFYSPSQFIYNNPNKFISPSHVQYPIQNPLATTIPSFQNEQDPSLDNLASLVYKKLLMKKKLRSHASPESESNVEIKPPKKNSHDKADKSDRSDDFLIRVVNGNNKVGSSNNHKSEKSNLNLLSANQNNQNKNTIDSYNENEESKLIEDLFFIK